MADRSTRGFVRLNGEEPPGVFLSSLESVEVDEIVAGRPAPTSEIRLSLADPTYQLTDAEQIRPGTTVDVFVSLTGEPQDATHLARGSIVKLEPSFGGTGSLTVYARDDSDAARAGTVVKTWGKRSDADRVRTIAQRRGWATTWRGTSSIGTGGGVVARDQHAPDMQYLADLAELYAYDTALLWDNDAGRSVLWWGPRFDRGDPSRDYRFNDSDHPVDRQVLDFRPLMLSAAQAPTSVRVLGYSVQEQSVADGRGVKSYPRDPVTGAVHQFQGPLLRSRKIFVGSRIRTEIAGESVVIPVGVKIRDQRHAQEYATNWLRERADAFITGQARFLGDPTLRAGQTHALSFYRTTPQGLPDKISRFSGDYWLSSVRHKLDATTYTVEAGVRLRADRSG